MGDHAMLMTTVSSEKEAGRIATALLERRLAACIQVTAIHSHYVWEGDLVEGAEQLLLVKTTAGCVAEAQDAIVELHDYETPEVLVVPISSGSPGYLAWMNGATRA